jgi:hypothetical protein
MVDSLEHQTAELFEPVYATKVFLHIYRGIMTYEPKISLASALTCLTVGIDHFLPGQVGPRRVRFDE